MEQIKNRHSQTARLLRTIAMALTSVLLLGSAASCNDDPDAENYYTFTGEMVSNYLDARSDIYSDFIAVLHKSNMYGMMATYGTYTCFAPTNDAFKDYFREHGIKSVDEMSKAECDTLAWNHIIKNAYFTNTAIALFASDGDGNGLDADFVVTSFSRSEPLEEALTVSVTCKPTLVSRAPTWKDGGGS